jgi:N utilization substance protein A
VVEAHVVDPATQSVRVVVPDFQLSLAIGREGQNARLAARLTGWRIDIHSDAEQAGDRPGDRAGARRGDAEPASGGASAGAPAAPDAPAGG